MNEYKERIRRRARWMWAVCALTAAVAIVLFVLIGAPKNVDEHLQGFIQGMQTGLLTCIFILSLRYGILCLRAAKDETQLRKMHIQETDERSLMIRDKIGRVGVYVNLVVLALATVVAGYFDKTVFLTLLSALLFASLTTAALKLYYRRKF